MLKRIAIALVAASMLTAPTFAQGGPQAKPAPTTSAATGAAIANPAAKPARVARVTHKRIKHVRHVRHTKRVVHVKHVKHVKSVKHIRKHVRRHAVNVRHRASAATARHLGNAKPRASIKPNAQLVAPRTMDAKPTAAN